MMNTAGFNVDVRLCNPPTGNNVRWPVGAFLESVSVNLAANINALHAVTVLLVGGDPALDAALRVLACQGRLSAHRRLERISATSYAARGSPAFPSPRHRSMVRALTSGESQAFGMHAPGGLAER